MKIRMSKKVQKNIVTILTILAIMFVAAYFSITSEKLKDVVIIIISLIAAVAVFLQIRQGTDIAKAEFVMGLQETFSNSKGFSELFMICWEVYQNKTNESVEEYLKDNISKGILLNYLTFFESVYIMKDQGNLNFEILDELFGRRFFIVVTNKDVQEADLVPNIAYYDNVKKLYIEWKEYREKVLKSGSSKRKDKERKKKFLEFEKNGANKDLEKAIEEYN